MITTAELNLIRLRICTVHLLVELEELELDKDPHLRLESLSAVTGLKVEEPDCALDMQSLLFWSLLHVSDSRDQVAKSTSSSLADKSDAIQR